MSDWPNDVVAGAPVGTLSTIDETNPATDGLVTLAPGFTSAGAWASAGLAIYVPVFVRAPALVYQMAWSNGGTLGSNVDVGIYDGASKARFISTGSTAQAGANALQAVDVADTVVTPGLHYLAMAMDTITPGLVVRAAFTLAQVGRVFGMAQQASAFPLPPTAVFAPLTAAIFPQIVAAIQSNVF